MSLTVGDLPRAKMFYTGALGFTVRAPPRDADPALARLLGAHGLHTVLLERGAQQLELVAFDPPGAPYPPGSRSNDLWFQHCALVTQDIAASYARLLRHDAAPISRNGPQTLPGGIVAFKFRDRDGHPLELIQFPKPDPATAGGIDHSAISVADADRSVAFYASLGMGVASRQVNTGPAQDALDGLDGARVDVVAMAPERPAPHVELLAYHTPPGRTDAPMQPSDLAASRLVVLVDSLAHQLDAVALGDEGSAALIHDPDGHALLLVDSAPRIRRR